MTFEEHRGPIEGRTVAWTGDGNNVLASWAHAAERFRFRLNVATPPELAPKQGDAGLDQGERAPIVLGNDPEDAVRGADCVVTDTWVSMGDKDGEHRHNLLKPYQVNAKLMSLAKPDALFMHCLPAHRGEEVTDEVIDGPQSVVFDEAENRLHAQKGILAWCFDAVGRAVSTPAWLRSAVRVRAIVRRSPDDAASGPAQLDGPAAMIRPRICFHFVHPTPDKRHDLQSPDMKTAESRFARRRRFRSMTPCCRSRSTRSTCAAAWRGSARRSTTS